jgi:hypothetical protein
LIAETSKRQLKIRLKDAFRQIGLLEESHHAERSGAFMAGEFATESPNMVGCRSGF